MTRLRVATLIALASGLAPGVALAHGTAADERWPLAEPVVAGVVLLLVSLVYATGVASLWTHVGVSHGIGSREVMTYTLGVILGVASIVMLSWRDQFAPHMADHLLGVNVVVPLLVLGRVDMAAAWAVHGGGRVRSRLRWLAARAVRPAISNPALVAAAFIATLWMWHLTTLYEAAAHSSAIHVLEHATLFATAAVYWRRALVAARAPRRGGATTFTMIFAVMLSGLALGAFLTFASMPLYPSAEVAAGAGALFDQQLGGLMMLMGGGLTHVAVLLAALLRLLASAAADSVGYRAS